MDGGPAVYRPVACKTERPVQASRSIREISIYVNTLYKESTYLPKMVVPRRDGADIHGSSRAVKAWGNGVRFGDR